MKGGEGLIPKTFVTELAVPGLGYVRLPWNGALAVEAELNEAVKEKFRDPKYIAFAPESLINVTIPIGIGSKAPPAQDNITGAPSAKRRRVQST